MAARAGLIFYDAPFLGTRQPAEQGQLIVLGSGPEVQRTTVQPVFDAMAKKTIWVADRPGASSRRKRALDAWVLVLTHGVAESLSIAKGLGVDPALVIEAVTGGQRPATCKAGRWRSPVSASRSRWRRVAWITSFFRSAKGLDRLDAMRAFLDFATDRLRRDLRRTGPMAATEQSLGVKPQSSFVVK